MGLAGLAITQPVLDLLGRNPEFFVAGRYTSSQIVALALTVVVVPSAVLVAVFGLSWVAHPRLGRIVHTALVAALGALFGNVTIRGLQVDGDGAALVATVAGAVLAGALVRPVAGRLLLRYVAAAQLLFLGSFLVLSPVSDLLAGEVGGEALGTVSVPTPPGPVVVIVFDELPLPTLMRTDGTINAERFPAFARLAAGSTWFRNASSPHNRTERAVPALMTGTVLEQRAMPTYSALPHNLLALLATAVPVERYEPVTDLCPANACAARPGQPLSQALEDALVVFGHRALPASIREDLPPIDDAWGSFGDSLDVAAPEETTGTTAPEGADPLERWHGAATSERDPSTQATRLVEHGLAIGAAPALHFVHVVLPHSPWFITPWDTRLLPPMPAWEDEQGRPAGPWSELIRFQRHSLQTGAADVALGQVLDHLETTGVWDDATVVVVADHGTSTFLPDVGRIATANNKEEVYRVPLFVKAAGQEEASVVDDVALTVDVLPTLIDLLRIETDWEMDGHSLLDGSARTTEPVVDADVEPLLDLVRRHAAGFPHGWDWTALAAVGEHGGLVGSRLGALTVGPTSALRVEVNNEDAFGRVPDGAGRAPQLVTGVVTGSADRPPPSLVLVVNGTVAGVTGGYVRVDDGWSFSSVLGPYLHDGANEIAAYEVARDEGQSVLHLVP